MAKILLNDAENVLFIDANDFNSTKEHSGRIFLNIGNSTKDTSAVLIQVTVEDLEDLSQQLLKEIEHIKKAEVESLINPNLKVIPEYEIENASN